MGTERAELLDRATHRRRTVVLFFCSAVIQAVNEHRSCCAPRSRAPGRTPPRRQRGPLRSSDFLGTDLEKVFTAIEAGKVQPSKPGSFLGFGTPVCALPLARRDATHEPVRFTGNKFEFRAWLDRAAVPTPS